MLVPPRSIQHPDYGFSVGRGAFKFVTGRWMRITERVKVNSLGKEDGECKSSTAIRALRDAFTSYLQAKSKCLSMANPLYSPLDSSSALKKDRMAACKGFIYRHSSVVRTLHISLIVHSLTARVGNSPDWASPKQQRAWFANISGAILAPGPQHDEL